MSGATKIHGSSTLRSFTPRSVMSVVCAWSEL